jgi:hypothetical protein
MKRADLQRLIAAAVVALLAMLAVSGCSDDNPAGGAGGSGDGDDQVEVDDGDAFSGADQPFADQVARFTEELEAATDLCGVFAATDLVPVAPPSDSAEARLAMTALLLHIDQMAAFTGSTETANLLRSSSVGLREYAEQVDYDPAALDIQGDGPDTPASGDYRAGVELWLDEAGEECSTGNLDE